MDALEHFVLPLIKSYIADGDFPPFKVAFDTLIFFFANFFKSHKILIRLYKKGATLGFEFGYFLV